MPLSYPLSHLLPHPLNPLLNLCSLFPTLPLPPQDVNDPKNLWQRFHANQYTGAAVLAAIVVGKLTAG